MERGTLGLMFDDVDVVVGTDDILTMATTTTSTTSALAPAALASMSVSIVPRIDICNCVIGGVKMQLCTQESKMICPKCSKAISVKGTVVDDQQYQAQDGGVGRNTGGRVYKTFTQYWDPIIGIERWDVSQAQESVDRLITHLNQNGFITLAARKTLTCDLMYKYIKELGMTDKLSKHITRLLVHFGVTAPHKPDDTETKIVYDRYISVLGVYDRIKDDISKMSGGKKRANNITRPYYIYKIIETTFDKKHQMRTILPFIHLQHRDTVISNDLTWKTICENLRFTYYPTDRNNA